jgi:membrane protein DedA with SNARE-associated domain
MPVLFRCFTGVILEGEVASTFAAWAAQNGRLVIIIVGGVTLFGIVVTDCSWFFIGRIAGLKILSRFSKLDKHRNKIEMWITRYPYLIVFVYRILYGLRVISFQG